MSTVQMPTVLLPYCANGSLCPSRVTLPICSIFFPMGWIKSCHLLKDYGEINVRNIVFHTYRVVSF